MKQYTTQEQTTKLIELGFEKPKSYHDIKWSGMEVYDYQLAYSIGELIEMLPKKIEAEVTDEYDSETAYLQIEEGWAVSYFNGWCTVEKCTRATELIDALYEMIVKLKEEGVI
jgi:hypothetical protein